MLAYRWLVWAVLGAARGEAWRINNEQGTMQEELCSYSEARKDHCHILQKRVEQSSVIR